MSNLQSDAPASSQYLLDGCMTVFDAFALASTRWPDAPFLALTDLRGRRSDELPYGSVMQETMRWIGMLRAAGYGGGDRVAVSVGNQPAHFVLHLALNAIGASIVPINPDMSAAELAYVLDHSESCLVVTDAVRTSQVMAALRMLAEAPSLMALDASACPPAARPASVVSPTPVGIRTESSLLYTSGTTGRPKGCVISNAYYLRIGRAYLAASGVATVRPAQERILNPLPVFHQNAGIFSFMCAVLSGNCILMTDRFHASTWWREVAASEATIIHYLGVMPAILMKAPATAGDRQHRVRFGIGAGVEPSLHRPFEERFGFPLVELWGMTEVGFGFADSIEPRERGTRAVGGPRPGNADDLQVRLINSDGEEVLQGSVGELLVRRAGDDPADGMFSGYLKDEAATREAWKGGWFHTGDAFWQDARGILHFAERKKNIIRRSGENIAAAEVEAVLLEHPGVARVAVIAVPDEIREEEVMACVVKAGSWSDDALSDELVQLCMRKLAYYKAPGWFVFLDTLPVTTTQKVQKARIFTAKDDPRTHARAIDLRAIKKRSSTSDRETL